MRSRGALALLLLMLTLAGCAAKGSDDGVATANGSKPKASASTQPSASNEDNAVKFAQCMRQHGMSWFPDPQQGGGMKIKIPQGTDKAKVDAAMEACKQYMPNGGAAPKMDPQALEQARKLARCMREHGVPNFPDPKPDGSLQLDGDKLGMGPGDPKFDAAEKACARYQPNGPGGASTERATVKS